MPRVVFCGSPFILAHTHRRICTQYESFFFAQRHRQTQTQTQEWTHADTHTDTHADTQTLTLIHKFFALTA